jgi:hypothetical protein
MTRIDKSPEMLDAAAANRAQPIEERDLSAAILMHRTLYAADLNWLSKLHVRDGESGIGVPFNPVFEAFLDGRLGQFPWNRALFAVRVDCRANHAPKHTDRPEWRGSLCYVLTSLVIRFDYSLLAARLELGLPLDGKTRRTLDNALLFIESDLKLQHRRQEQAQSASVARMPAEWMGKGHVHVGLPGLHRDECPQCARAA